MFDELIRRWWIVALRGTLAVLFGLAILLAPGRTLALFVSLFGMFALADGVFTIGAGLSVGWLTLFLQGTVGVIIGAFTLAYPPAVELGLEQLIVTWAFVTGVLEVAGAWRLRRAVVGPMVQGEWLLGASGLLSIAFGAMLAAGVGPFPWIVGGFALVSGVLLVALALNVRTWQPTLQTT
jgi:uncharacterized membrane protein HdeD (DUF308 family)